MRDSTPATLLVRSDTAHSGLLPQRRAQGVILSYLPDALAMFAFWRI